MDVVREQEMVFPEDVRFLPFQGMDESEAGGVVPKPRLSAVLVEKDILARGKTSLPNKGQKRFGRVEGIDGVTEANEVVAARIESLFLVWGYLDGVDVQTFFLKRLDHHLSEITGMERPREIKQQATHDQRGRMRKRACVSETLSTLKV